MTMKTTGRSNLNATASEDNSIYQSGDELKIGRTMYRVVYAVLSKRQDEKQILIVEPVRGIARTYRVRVGNDGSFSEPGLISE